MNKVATRLAEIKKRGMQKRTAEVGAVDVDARTVELSFSSEIEVDRWYGIEILSHDPGACDLSRLNDSAAFLWGHNQNDMRGVVESARIDSDRKGRALVRMSKSAEGEKLLQDMADKIVTKVSVGYLVNGMRLIETRGDDIDVWSVNAWQPYEISAVSVPADASVGIGRSVEIPTEADEVPAVQTSTVIDIPQPAEATRKKMTEEEKAAAAAAAAAANAAAAQRGTDTERERVRSIMEAGKAYANPELAATFVSEGKSVEEFNRALLAKMNTHANKPLEEQVRGAEIGLTEKEAKSFSFMRAIRAQMPNASAAERADAGFELECSRAAEKLYGKTAQGILIPADVLNQRTFATTTPVGGPGSHLIETQLLAGSFIDILRKKAWLMGRATTLGGLVGNIDIPRQNGSTSAYWVGEGADATASDPSVDQISFSPNTLAGRTEITRRLMKQATPDAENLVRNDLLRVMALEIDRAGIYALGSANQPQGLSQMTGINAVPFAGAMPTFAELVAMETAIAMDNADEGSMSYAFNAAFRGYAKTALKFPTTASGATIWETGNTVNGYATNTSNQIVSGDVFFGNWADFIIAMWGGLDLTVDPYSLSASGGTRIVTFQEIDFNVRHLESFCYGKIAA